MPKSFLFTSLLVFVIGIPAQSAETGIGMLNACAYAGAALGTATTGGQKKIPSPKACAAPINSTN